MSKEIDQSTADELEKQLEAMSDVAAGEPSEAVEPEGNAEEGGDNAEQKEAGEAQESSEQDESAEDKSDASDEDGAGAEEGEASDSSESEADSGEGTEASEADDKSGKESQPAGARARIKMRELEEKNRKLQRELEERQRAESGMDDPVASFKKASENGDDSQESRALGAIREMGSDAILEKLKEYGNDPDVSRALRDSLTEAVAREKHEETQRKAQDEEVERLYRAEAGDAKEAYPKFFESDAEEAKFMRQWDAKNIGRLAPDGTFEQEGELPEDLSIYLLNHPHAHAQVVDLAYQASKTDALNGQIKSLKAKLAKAEKAAGLKDQPETGGGPQTGGSEATPDSSEYWLKQLESLSP